MRLLTYRLAERLHMIRDEMLERMSAEELGDWLAIMHMEAQSSKDASETTAPTTPTARQQSPAEMFAVLKAFSPKKDRKAKRA